MRKLTPVILPAPSLLATMEVMVPEQPVVALHGRDATLNCSFSSNASFNLSDLAVFWQLTDTQRSVHSYMEGRDQLVDQAEVFANRTSLFASQLGLGNASLLLKEVGVADEGSYTCFVRVRDYGSAALLLQVAGESTSDVCIRWKLFFTIGKILRNSTNWKVLQKVLWFLVLLWPKCLLGFCIGMHAAFLRCEGIVFYEASLLS